MTEFWKHIKFANPEAFYLLALPALMLLYYAWRYNSSFPKFKLSSLQGVAHVKSGWKVWLKQSLFLFRIAALCLLIVCLARPQSSMKEDNVITEGIDIVMSLDVSGSMLAKDFKPDRLEAAKSLSVEFVEGRPTDRIGFVVFAGESFTQCPITTDHAVLKKLISEVKDGLIEDGTAIGMGLATAVNRLQDSEAKSKVIILLTDGVSNAGFIDPLTAADLAIQNNIRVYTVGVGTRGMAPYPFKYGNRTVYQDVEVQIDEELMKKIAAATGGLYFRATNNQSLKSIFDEIDTLEKSKIEVASVQRVSEEFLPFALFAALFLLLEMLLKYSVLRSVV
jgi:Ca-activated chloride channel homolog